MKVRPTALLLGLATLALTGIAASTAGCDPPPEKITGRCSLDTADQVINSCYYCCFAEPGHPGAYTGCFSGSSVTEERCREHLIEDKNCTEPYELEIQLGCQCDDDCDDPDWY
jgi:hypothetical protein